MRSFDYTSLLDRTWDSETLDRVAKIHECKGRLESGIQQKTAQLDRMAALAVFQSTEASNAIEGIRTSDARLKKLCAGKTTPRSRDERDILGYRNTLRTINRNYRHIPFRPEYILLLNRDLYRFSEKITGTRAGARGESADPGQDRDRAVSFSPAMPYETARAMEQLCDGYNRAADGQIVNSMLLIPNVIHDFLCIQPFGSGSRRMSRLLTMLLMYRSGYMAGKYISLERIISEDADAYNKALEQSRNGWQEGADDPAPFIRYHIRVVLAAYQEFEQRMDPMGDKLSALNTVRRAVSSMEGKMTKAELMTLCPGLAKSSVEAAIKKLVEAGELQKQGSGRATFYTGAKP